MRQKRVTFIVKREQFLPRVRKTCNKNIAPVKMKQINDSLEAASPAEIRAIFGENLRKLCIRTGSIAALCRELKIIGPNSTDIFLVKAFLDQMSWQKYVYISI